MNRGRVHDWVAAPTHPLRGRIVTRVVDLPNLDGDGRGLGRLWGRFVRVRNASIVNRPDPLTTLPKAVPVGDALPNSDGDFMFDPERGGARIDKRCVRSPKYLNRYISASHFGEVNAYFHVDRIASYVSDLLRHLGAPSLPRVIIVVNAHGAAVDISPGIRDGTPQKDTGFRPFKGGHYRLPAARYAMCEYEALSPDGEIHLGPGWRLIQSGALVELTGRRYRANASHNAGIIYHEYGHHITRHTADFMLNRERPADAQRNGKTALDEAICDYFTGVMLDSPHVWAWHQRHDAGATHVRSLVSQRSMADFDPVRGADSHANGTIFAAALWTMRQSLGQVDPAPFPRADLLVLRMLLLLGEMNGDSRSETIQLRSTYSVALASLLKANQELCGGEHGGLIDQIFAARGIRPDATNNSVAIRSSGKASRVLEVNHEVELEKLRQRVGPDEVPDSVDLLSPDDLEAQLLNGGDPRFTLIAVGDVMLWGRAKAPVQEHGDEYQFAAVLPLLRRAHVGLANLEGPMASRARKQERTFSYRVPPKMARSLRRVGLGIVTLANNHLTDCGRQGVVETLSALRQARVMPIGAGLDYNQAHKPAIVRAGRLRIGFLGYYWNRRTAATKTLPGSAMDTADDLARDVLTLRPHVDRIVVAHHWGIPYVREVADADRAKARLAIDCGADLVIGHHAHIMQAFEIYRSRPIFYGLGNFAFGSGNSRAESLLLGAQFEKDRTVVEVYPVYVKNRDPRVAYQPKVMAGRAATRILDRLRSISGESAASLCMNDGIARVELQWSPLGEACIRG